VSCRCVIGRADICIFPSLRKVSIANISGISGKEEEKGEKPGEQQEEARAKVDSHPDVDRVAPRY
jgi:hypothetical protein